MSSPAQPSLEVGEALLSARMDVIRDIQQALAGTADAIVANGAETQRRTKAALGKAMAKVTKARNGVVGGVQADLGSAAGEMMASRAATVNTVGTAAAVGGATVFQPPAMVTAVPMMPPQPPPPAAALPSFTPLPPPPPGAHPLLPPPPVPTAPAGGVVGKVGVYYLCLPKPALMSQPWSPAMDLAMQESGWLAVDGSPFIDANAAQQWINANGGAWLADKCGNASGGGGGGGGGGGTGGGGGSILPGLGSCWKLIQKSTPGTAAPPCMFPCQQISSNDGTFDYFWQCCPPPGADDAWWNGSWAAKPSSMPPGWTALVSDLCPVQQGGGGTSGGGSGVGCPPPPACPPPPSPTPYTPPGFSCAGSLPALQCSQALNGKLPPVGSVEWCQCIEAVSTWLDGVGQWFVDNINALVDPSDDNNVASDIVKGLAINSAFPVVGASLFNAQTLGVFKDLLFKSDDSLKCIWQGIKSAVSIYAEQSSPRLLGLTVCRALLRAFRHLRVGWELGPVAMADLEVVVRPLEQILDYIENYNFRYEIPAVGEAIECYVLNTATEEQVRCWMACHGADFDVYHPVIDSRREKLTVEQSIQFLRRKGFDTDTQTEYVRNLGFTRPKEAAAVVYLYDELPSVSDVLHFQQRNVFDTQYVQDYGLMEGFTEKFYPRYGPGLRALGVSEQTIADHYAAHWINPSVGQLAEMVMRLRPGRVDPTLTFTSTDFIRVLGEQDVAPYFRKRLLATAYRTIPLRQLNQAVQYGLFDKAELAQRWMDIGFTADDAARQATASMYQAARQAASAGHGFTAAILSELVQYTLIDPAIVQAQMKAQGFTDQQINDLVDVAQRKKQLADYKKHEEGAVNAYATLAVKAFADGAVTRDNARQALINASYPPDAADLALDTASLRVRMETLDLAIKRIHKGFMGGEVNAAGALALLLSAGVVPDMAAVYVSRWQLEQTVRRVSATAAQIIKWAKAGILSVANAVSRLTNLGWTQDNIDLTVAEIDQTIARSRSLAAARAAAQLAKAQNAAKKAMADSQKQFCKLYSPAKMVKWYAERIIDESEFYSRLDKCGYTKQSADNLFAEATLARQAKDAKAAAKGSAGIQYTGPGHDTG